MSRFVVIETHGYLTPHQHGGRGPGVACSVLDQVWDRVVATYRSEHQTWKRGHLRVRAARRKAREHAERLEAEHGGR